jgi:hypothetical protein
LASPRSTVTHKPKSPKGATVERCSIPPQSAGVAKAAVAPSGLWEMWGVGFLGLANGASPRLHA